jgi:hypothetical protein
MEVVLERSLWRFIFIALITLVPWMEICILRGVGCGLILGCQLELLKIIHDQWGHPLGSIGFLLLHSSIVHTKLVTYLLRMLRSSLMEAWQLVDVYSWYRGVAHYRFILFHWGVVEGAYLVINLEGMEDVPVPILGPQCNFYLLMVFGYLR